MVVGSKGVLGSIKLLKFLQSYLDLILHVGEDFELLFTISRENLERLPIDCIVIGEVNDSDVIELTLENGFVERIKNEGYEHYVSE
jgi:thiamine-monophosphate kinase